MDKTSFFVLIAEHPGLDREVLERAWTMAERAHTGQVRKSGEPYLTHPAEVAAILARVGMDTPTVTAALLHDVAEDTAVTVEEVRAAFGDEVAFFVESVTKLRALPRESASEARLESLRKMFMATAQDIRVALIKLADRIHNMRSLGVFPPEKRARIARETMEVYAPLAERLGMGEWKGELQDRAFEHLYPEEFAHLQQRLGQAYDDAGAYVARIMPIIRGHLNAEGVPVLELHGRKKHLWSLYQKLRQKEFDLGNVHDLVALRIIVPGVEDCYRALGVVHQHYTPIPGRIKDYIALPKGSGYRSLHTVVFCEDGRITEFQIRTPEMHREAEFGIAAHWHYKETGKREAYRGTGRLGRRMQWIEQVQEWQKAAKGSQEFVDALRLEFLKTRIFVLTPKGDVIDLPQGATAVDFAYTIHSAVGHRCTGAKADGRIVPLASPLENGAVVEILTKKEPGPNRDWLEFVKTTEARKKITAWFNREREEAEPTKAEAAPQKAPEPTWHPRTPTGEVMVHGMSGVLTRIARCCSPLPGEAIEGYVTLAGGVAIHRADCAGLGRVRDARRRIPVSWALNDGAGYAAALRIQNIARVGMLRDITEALSKLGRNIFALTSRDGDDGIAEVALTVEVHSASDLQDVIARLKAIPGITSVERT